MRKVKAGVMERGLELRMKGDDREWEVNQLLYADDGALVADSEGKLSNLGEFVCGG